MTVRAFVLSGGGAKGAWQVGAMRRVLEQTKEPIDAFFGVSTGALSAAMVAQAVTIEGQRQQVDALARIYKQEITGNRSIYLGPRTVVGKAFRLLRRQLFGGPPALYNPAPLEALVRQHIDPELLAVGSYFACGCVDAQAGTYHLVDRSSPNILAAIMASASMPIYFPPVDVYGDGATFFDGGLRSITPLRDAVRWLKQQPDHDRELYVFLTSPLSVTEQTARAWFPTRVLGRSLEIVLNTIYNADLRQLRQRSRAVALRAVTVPPGEVVIRCAVMAPSVHLAGHALNFDPDLLADYMAAGYDTYPETPFV